MKEELTTFKTAKLAKDKGFNCGCHNYFYGGEGHENTYANHNTPYIKDKVMRPTQSLLHRWLREVHEINIEATYLPNAKVYKSLFVPMDNSISLRDKYGRGSKYYGNIDYKTYEEALEEGLFEALKLIKL